MIIPERAADFDAIKARLAETYARGKKHSFLIVAEGAGDAQSVAREIAERTRHEAKWVVLGHTQRGGPPTAHDRIMAALYADKAIELLTAGVSGLMVSARGASIAAVSLEDAVSGHKKSPLSWLDLAEILAR